MPLFYDWAKIHCSHFRNCSKKKISDRRLAWTARFSPRQSAVPSLYYQHSWSEKNWSPKFRHRTSLRLRWFMDHKFWYIFWLFKWTLLGIMSIAFTGFIIILKLNYCHKLSTDPGYRNCSVDWKLIKNLNECQKNWHNVEHRFKKILWVFRIHGKSWKWINTHFS